MSELPNAYFHEPEPGWFVGTSHTRGPWDADSCHAGPPTGLLARAAEHCLHDAGIDHQLVRLTVELIRPVPMQGFRVSFTTTRKVRSTTGLSGVITDGQSRECALASALAIRVGQHENMPTSPIDAPEFANAQVRDFPITRAAHDLPGFVGSIEVKYPPAETPEPGPTTAWMRTVPLLATEAPSPFQKICPLADCGNAFSRNAQPWEIGFVNPDLTVILHRPPRGDWFATRSHSAWEDSGIGLASATLFDRDGVVGRALQTLLLTPYV